MRISGIIVAASLFIGTSAMAADPVGPNLTPRLKELIAKEMQQVAEATSDLAVAISAGDHHTVMELGIAVRDSFILKKSLTDQDKKDLMGAVPKEFVALDRDFHGLAGKLAHAAEAKDSELQGFYFAEMLQRCVACHSHFATDKFPGFAKDSGGGHDH